MPNQKLPELVRELIAEMKGMSDAERHQIISAITDHYCVFCGRDQSTTLRGCQCTNDE